MPQVYCIDWSEDDEVLGPREDGFSLHLSLDDAAAFAREHQSRQYGHSGPYLVTIPDDLYQEVRQTRHGLLKNRPRECPYPKVEADEVRGGHGNRGPRS